MKTQIGKIQAVPSKRVFLSIIADYDLNLGISELIDNALDTWIKTNKDDPLNINIELDMNQQTISVRDNAGGIRQSDLYFVVAPGQTGNQPSEETIGIFGVGTKRAVVALSEDIKITTRYGKEPTYRVEFDQEWLQDDSWELPYYEVNEIDEGTTVIELQKLRLVIDEAGISKLKEHLRATYARFLLGEVKIQVNRQQLKPLLFED